MITDSGQLKFVAEGIRPAADRIIGGYDYALPLLAAWDDANDSGRLLMWEAVNRMANVLWKAFIESGYLIYPWDDILSRGFPDDETDIDDSHSKPIKSKHVHRVVEGVRQIGIIANATEGQWRKVLFVVKSYTSQPANTIVLVGVIAGLKSLVAYLDDDANSNDRRKRIRETATNPNLFTQLPS